MLRKFLRPASQQIVKIRHCSSVAQPKVAVPISPYAIHNISLTGRIDELYNNENNATICYLKSNFKNGNFLETHKIRLSQSLVHILREKLQVGQLVHITGKLDTSSFTTSDRKHRISSTIVANDMYLCEDSTIFIRNDSELSKETDENQINFKENYVELLGRAVGSLREVANFKVFTLSVIKNPSHDQSSNTLFMYNQVFVYNKALYPVLESIYEDRNRLVLIRGKLNYKVCKDDKGKLKTSAHITAKQLYQIHK